MGASTFEEYGYGKTAKEAFRKAHEEACYEYGNGGYTGSLAEKSSFVEIPVPKEYAGRPMDYVNKLMEEDDRRISDKWGPAGCVLLESSDAYEEVPYATVVTRTKQEGARKWETVYKITGPGQYVRYETSQTEAEKVAKDYVKAHNVTLTITIEKRLMNGNPRIVTISPKTKTVKSKLTNNKYIFFGWASC